MTPEQLSEIEARLRECKNPHCDHGVCMGEQCWTCGGDGFMEPTQDDIAEAIRKAAADIAALIAEVKRLREALRQACTCATCNGAGEIDFVTGYKDNGPNDPIEVYELDECPECAGQKIGSHVEESTARVLEDCQ